MIEVIVFLVLVLAGGLAVGFMAAEGGVGITVAAVGWYVLAAALVVFGMFISLGEGLCEYDCTPTRKDSVVFALAGFSLLVSVAVALVARYWPRD